VEIILSIISVALTLVTVFASRTDKLLREIRDVLIQIRDK